MSGVVIVGTGVAGATTASALRASGYDGAITVLGAEPRPPYRRPALSKDVLLKGVAFEKILLRPAQHWADSGIDVLSGAVAVGADTSARRLELAGGETLAYEHLVLATGATARRLPGLEPNERVHYLRDHADAERLRGALADARSVAVLGAGLIGAEIASAAVSKGVSVTLIDPAPLPLARVVPPLVGERLAQQYRGAGVDLRVGTETAEVEVSTGGVRLHLPDETLQTDLLVVAVGAVPETSLASALAARVDDGIVVDERYRTTVDHVYAIGDCARLPHPIEGGRSYRAENFSAAQDHGTALAEVLLGRPTAPTVPWGWSQQFGTNLQFAGWPAPSDEVEVDAMADDGFVIRCVRNGRVSGAVAANRPKDLRALRVQLAAAVGEESAVSGASLP